MLGGPVTAAALSGPQSLPDLTAAAVARSQVGLQSPMAAEPNGLQAVVWADLTGQEFRGVDRAAAMSIPAMARQRHLVCGVAAGCPLVLVDEATGTRVPDQPRWLTNGAAGVPAFHRTLWTVDDLLFGTEYGGLSLWWTDRDDSGAITNAERIPPVRWELDEVDRVVVDGEYATEDEVVVIPGPHEGVLNFGASSLRRTLDNLDAARNAARNPAAYLELHYTGTEPLTPADKETLLDDWAAARRGERGGVAFTGPNLEVKEHGTHEAALLIEGRNADAVDVSRLVSSPAAMADATTAGASLTYETTEGRGLQFLDYGASLYMDALVARLSMDDVAGQGYRVAFDVSQARQFSDTPTTGQE